MTAAPDIGIEQLFDEAWTVDCAIRLHQPSWAVAVAQRLAAELVGHAQRIEACWAHLDPAVAESLVTETRAMRVVLLAMVDDLERGAAWPCADMHDRMERLIHQEVCAAADAAWQVD
jgi:hypothetical protein